MFMYWYSCIHYSVECSIPTRYAWPIIIAYEILYKYLRKTLVKVMRSKSIAFELLIKSRIRQYFYCLVLIDESRFSVFIRRILKGKSRKQACSCVGRQAIGTRCCNRKLGQLVEKQ